MSDFAKSILFLCTAKLVFALQDVVVKELSGGYPVHQMVVIRGLVALPIILLLIWLVYGMSSLAVRRPHLHLLRGALMFGAFISFYMALAVLPLTTATALFFTAPFFITLLSVPFLGETVGIRRWTGVIAGFAGVLIVLRPESAEFGWAGLLPVIAAVFYALCQILARRLGLTDNAAVMTFYANVSFVILGTILAIAMSGISPTGNSDASMQFLLRDWAMPDFKDALLLAATGLSASIGFFLSSRAYSTGEANAIAPFEYVMIIWVTILSYIVWSEVPDGATLAGTTVIIAAGLYVLKREKAVVDRPIAHRGLNRVR